MKQQKTTHEPKQQVNESRRNLLIGGGTLAAGIALTKMGGLLGTAEASELAKTWPWPYVKLDPDKTAELAYEAWYEKFCAAAVIQSVFSQLAEKVGEPYKSFPVDGLYFLAGGIADWGTLCGTNSGANAVVNLIIGPKIQGHQASWDIGSNLLYYYSNTAMPVYTPKNPRIANNKIPRTQSDSPLCHISVGKWMKEANVTASSPERKDRCARLAASMAHKTVLYLNDWKDGKTVEKAKWFAPAVAGMNAQENCKDCHGNNIPDLPGKKI